AMPLAKPAPASTSTWIRWRRWPRPPSPVWPPGPWRPPPASKTRRWAQHTPVPPAAKSTRATMKPGPSTDSLAPSNTPSRRATARPAVGIFFPQRPLLKLDTHAYTPRVLLKILEANGEVKSHEVAARVLRSLGGIAITGRHVNSLCAAIGAELAEQRDRATDDYLHHRRQPPQEAPAVAVIGMDGGRILTRAPGQGPGVHERHWKEDKVACLLSMTCATFADDPHPEPPRCFLDAPEVDKLVREIQSHHGPRLED